MFPMGRWSRVADRVFSLDFLWALLVPLGLFAALSRVVILPNDYWWHLRAGEVILQQRAVPHQDLFTFTRRGVPWMYQAWGTEVAFALLYRVGGLPLTIFAHALTITLGYTVVLRALARRDGIQPAALAVMAGAALAAWNWNVRPQTVSYLLFGVTLALLERYREYGGRQIWGLVPLFLVWGNLHGAFVFGGTLVAAYVAATAWEAAHTPAARARLWTLVAVGAAAALALGLNPYGAGGLVRYVLGFLQSDVTILGNMEFQPLTVRQPYGALFFGVTVVYGVLLWRARCRPAPAHVLALFLFGVGALWAQRMVTWYGFVLMPPLSAALRCVGLGRTNRRAGRPLLNALLMAVLVTAVGISLPWWRGRLPEPWAPARLVSETTPVAATRILCERAPATARVYQHQVFGSYQIWACPRLPVFIDTRLELYPTSLWEDYFAIENARFDWESIATQYDVTHLFLSTHFQPQAIRAARAASCWRLLYEDATAVIFERRAACPSTTE